MKSEFFLIMFFSAVMAATFFGARIMPALSEIGYLKSKDHPPHIYSQLSPTLVSDGVYTQEEYDRENKIYIDEQKEKLNKKVISHLVWESFIFLVAISVCNICLGWFLRLL